MKALVNDRIDVRINKELKDLIKYASELRGFKSLSEFILFSANKEATEIIIEHNQVVKSIEDKKIFINAILDPAAPNVALKKAQSNYLKFTESNGVKDRVAGKKAR